MSETTAYKELIEKAFSKHYEEGSDVWSQDDSLVEATRIAFERTHGSLSRDLHLLDLGCGNGRHSRVLAAHVASYTGIDLCEQPAWVTLTNSLPYATQFVTGDFLAWAESAAQTYDLILDNGCFHHQHEAEHRAYLTRVRELLKPDGVFSVVVWGEVFKEGNVDDYGRYHFHFTPDSISQLLTELSFDVIEVLESKALIGKRQLQVLARRGGVV